MKPKSLFSLSAEHKQMLRGLAEEGRRSMTAELERLIEKEYNDPHRLDRIDPLGLRD